MSKRTENFRTICTDVLSQSGNCEQSQHDFASADSVVKLCGKWQKYWYEMLNEVPQQVVDALEKHYSTYKKDINKSGIFYNEDSAVGLVIIGPSSNTVHISLARRAYIMAPAHVVLHSHANATCIHPDATVELKDSSSATMKMGYAIARNRSSLTTTCNAECHDSAEVYVTNATLHDYGHSRINAYGNSEIHTFTDSLIYLNDNSKIILDLSL